MKVEDWLELLAKEMRSTLAALLSQCLASKKFNWDYPSQVLCLAANIRFTDDCEDAIGQGRGGLEKLSGSLNATLRELTSHDLSDEPLLQLKMKALVLDVVRNIDVVDQLLARRSVRLHDWQWRKQLRYYYENKSAVVKMHDATFAYTYEYQGNAPKLVHTPLTDKCYLTLTQGMQWALEATLMVLLAPVRQSQSRPCRLVWAAKYSSSIVMRPLNRLVWCEFSLVL